MMWKDEGYMASGEKLVSPSLNACSDTFKGSSHASKAFNDASRGFNDNDASKSAQSCV